MTTVPHDPRDPAWEQRVRGSFARQQFMTTLGVHLAALRPGEVELTIQHRPELTQQHGYLHAGAVTAVVDSACGFAALSLMEPGAAVLSVEFKQNMLAPAAGTTFRAIGRVLKAGRTITVCSGELRAVGEEGETLVAVMQATMMTVRRPGLVD